jgi:hypothetical protein
MSEGIDRTSPAKKKRVRIHETTLENDIRYRGPLSSRHFKILGWLCLVLGQILMIVRLGGRLDAGFAADTASWLKALSNVADLSLPFLLIASFAQLLNTDEGYKRQLIVNGAAMAGICALYYLLFYRYTVGNVASLLETPSDALPIVKSGLATFAPYGFLTFNIFVDLFLCALTMVFLNYNPRRVFTGKWRICFRLLALLPIAYEVGCMLLKVRAAKGATLIPVWAYPLLTVKPPMTFVLFVALALFVKTRELRFRRHGKTHEEYQAFLKTRRNSWNFSVFLAIMLVVVSALDLAVAIGFSLDEVVNVINTNVEASISEAAASVKPLTPEELEAMLDEWQAKIASGATQSPSAAEPTPAPTLTPEARDALVRQALEKGIGDDQLRATIDSGVRLALAVGFGGSSGLFMLAPLMLLFSYTRKPKNPRLDLAIPAVGVALIVFLYLEGSHQLLINLPVKKFKLKDLENMLTLYLTMLM